MHRTLIAFGTLAAFGSFANADIAHSEPLIVMPFENTSVTVEWIESRAGYTGELVWHHPEIANQEVVLFNNKAASRGDRYEIPFVFSAGDAFDLSYRVIKGRKDVFSSFAAEDRDQFRFTEESSSSAVLAIEDIRLPRGDADYNDVRVRLLFGSVPAPGGLAVLGLLGIAAMRRSR